MTSFRESVLVILDTSRTRIRAGVGIHDLLKTPAVDIPARVALPRPTENADPEAGPSKSSSPKVTEYLVGSQIDDALAAGHDLDISWPFAEGDISDWTQAEALWKYVLSNQLHFRRLTMESPVLLSIFPSLSRDSYERLGQLFFERFNVAGFSILERPMAQFYAAVPGSNADLSGVVVDVGQRYTDITPIRDGFPVLNARETISCGLEDCKRYLAWLLRTNQSVMNALFPDGPKSQEETQSVLVSLARKIFEDGLVKVLGEGEAADIEEEGITDIAAVVVAGKEKAIIESGMKKRANAKASAAEQARAREIEAMDLVSVEFGDKSVTVGKDRHRFCEPLFDPALLKGIPTLPGDNRRKDEETLRPLQVAVAQSVGKIEPDIRQYIWQGLFVTGDITDHTKGLGAALQARLSPFILGTADHANEVQPKSIRVLKIPEYFAEYRDKGDGLASFLGSSIVAKIAFTDSSGKNFVSKGDYASRGPKVILEMSSGLL
ncbi:actin-like ATPase domain-containing protein [Abortiporus biennis]|nr:actin-like ATPase domain-containing protein [Abortiporus biennis]